MTTRRAYIVGADSAGKPNRLIPRYGPDVFPPPPPATKPGFTLSFEDQFTGGAIDPSSWFVYDNSNFGREGGRLQLYRRQNVVVGPGSAGATGGTSLKMLTKAEDITLNGINYNYTAGMLDTKSSGKFHPKYGYYEYRCKVPHGQSLWSSIWYTAKNGGADTWELDRTEIFHIQIPSRNSITLHGKNAAGAFSPNRYTNNVGGREYFEKPTYTPAWHIWAHEQVPVTDSTGNTLADPTQPSMFVRYTFWIDGVQSYRFVDTSAMYYTTNGGTADEFAQIYLQGCQVGSTTAAVGLPTDPLGYSSQRNACGISGTPPNACTLTRDGVNYVQAAVFSDPASTLELDYMKIYKYTG